MNSISFLINLKMSKWAHFLNLCQVFFFFFFFVTMEWSFKIGILHFHAEFTCWRRNSQKVHSLVVLKKYLSFWYGFCQYNFLKYCNVSTLMWLSLKRTVYVSSMLLLCLSLLYCGFFFPFFLAISGKYTLGHIKYYYFMLL